MKTHQVTQSKITRPRWAAVGAALALMVTGIAADAQTIPGVNVYPAVPGLAASDKYSVRVCAAAANPAVWNNVFTLKTEVPASPQWEFQYYDLVRGWSHSYVNFEMTVPVTVEISKVGGGVITTAAVSPARKARNVYVANGKAYLTMDNPCNVAVDIDGQMDARSTGGGAIHAISIHANPVLANKPATNGPGVLLVSPGTRPPETGSWTTLYFMPGVHDYGMNGFNLYSGKQYYIPGDAIVYASFKCGESGGYGNNIRFFGHGTVSGEKIQHWQRVNYSLYPNYSADGFNVQFASNCQLEGITFADSSSHNVLMGSYEYNASITNVVSWAKAFSWRVNSDGGGCGANNEVTNVFYRVQDDGLYLQGRLVNNNVLWNDVNGIAMRLSQLPNSPLLISNMDVIYSRRDWWTGSAAVDLAGDGGWHGNGVVFSNINFSDLLPSTPAINIDVNDGSQFSGARFENVTIADTRRNNLGSNNGSVHDLTFDNLVIGGVLVTPSNSWKYFNTYGNTYNINFTSSGTTPPDALPRTGWVATSSGTGTDPANTPAKAIDGDAISRWATGAIQANNQWFQVDMGSARTFNRIVMDAGSSLQDYPRGYRVEVSTTGAFPGTTVATGTASSAVLTVTFPPQTARYIRVTQTGSDPTSWWGIADFYVYPPISPLRWETGASVSNNGDPSSNAVDRNISTRWSTGIPQANGQQFQVDLGGIQTFDKVVLDAGASINDYPRGYQVQVTNDKNDWSAPAIVSGTGSSAVTTITFAARTARYIRVTQTGSHPSYWWGIAECSVNIINKSYTLTKNSPNGTIALNPAWPTYPEGTVVTVTATPNAGYVFNNWTGGLSGTAISTTLTMDGNKSITANFAASASTFTLTTSSANGTVTCNPPGPTYPINTVVTVTAVPNVGYVFNGWSGALSGSANPTTLTMNANKSITANIDYPVLSRSGWGVSASSSFWDSPSGNAIDGNSGSRWSTGAEQTSGQWFQVDLGSIQSIGKIVIDAGSSANDYPRGYQVHVSTDGLSWGNPVATGTGSAVTTITFAVQTARYIKVTQTLSAPGIWWSIHEFNVYGPAFPSPWQTADIGAVAAIGSVSYSSPTWTIAGSGADIESTADEFRYVYQSSSADCTNIARVTSMTNTNAWAKAGVMIRESAAANARNVMMCVTPTNGVTFQWRSTTGGGTSYTRVTGQTAPKWLKITRTGNSFAGFYSANGTTWTQVGTAKTITMATSATIGMAVTSHNDGTLCTSTMDNVTTTP